MPKVMTRLLLESGSTLYTGSPPDALEHVIERASKRGDSHVTVNGRQVRLASINSVNPTKALA